MTALVTASGQEENFLSNHCQKTHVRTLDYRPDIDGLRAIAVLSVLAFHAFPDFLPGGFVGVDIFFVISGYLISKHILVELDASAFKISNFYIRRIKRIFPALILVLLISGLYGWIMLTPIEYKQLGRSIAGGGGFVANLVLWQEAGYFDTAADTKPLLHLWSLGIEEQFYILWPFLLAFAWKRASDRLAMAILSICLLSLLYSLWLVQYDATADFYSPLTRLWELGIGSALAYAIAHDRLTAVYRYRQIIAWLAVALIASANLLIGKDSLFPGGWALVPTLSAAGLIFCGRTAWLNRVVIGSRPMAWIGLISYPLYLWHWPLLSYARIIEAQTPSVELRLILLTASFLLAWLTYKWVELPIRSKTLAQSRSLALILLILMSLIVASGIVIKKFDGFKFRVQPMLNGDAATLEVGGDRGRLAKTCGVADSHRSLFGFCLSDGNPAPKYAVLGDSKAEALFYGLTRELGKQQGGWLLGSIRPPQTGVAGSDARHIKDELAMQAVLEQPSIKLVIFAIALRSSFTTDSETGFILGDANEKAKEWLERYSYAIQRLEKAGKRVIIVVDNPTLPDPRSCVSGGMTGSPWFNQYFYRKPNPRCSIRYSDHLAGTKDYRQFLAKLAERNPNLITYDPTSILCDVPANLCSIIRDGKFLYSYSDHISDYANSLIARDMNSLIEPILQTIKTD